MFLRSIITGLAVTLPLTAAPIPRDVPAEPVVEPSAARLLFQKAIRKELKLTIPQVTAIVAEMRRLDESRVRRLATVGNLATADDRPLKRIALDHEAATRKATLDLAEQVLDASQRKRLAQIDRRLRGPVAFEDSVVQAVLQLAPDQRASILLAARAYASEETRYLSGAVDGDDTKLREELLTLRKETLGEIEDSLTPEQRLAWQILQGPVVVAFDPTDFELLRSIHR